MRPENPRLLILETSDRVGQVGLAEGNSLRGVRQLDQARRHARDLVPAVADLLNEAGWKAKELQGVIVSRGPGSYTGLRVGIMTAKALAYAAKAIYLAIDTFAVIARQAPPEVDRVEVVADAQHEKFYIQGFERQAAGWKATSDLVVEPLATWLAKRDPAAWIAGPGLRVHAEKMGAGAKLIDRDHWDPRVATLLEMGLARFRAMELDDFSAAEPLYLRPSSAEEKWQARGRLHADR